MQYKNPITQELHDVAVAFLKDSWVKRANSEKLVEEMKRLAPNWQGDTEPHYPGAITIHIYAEIDNVPRIFRLKVEDVTDAVAEYEARKA